MVRMKYDRFLQVFAEHVTIIWLVLFDHLTIFFAQDTGPLPISRNVFPINFSRIRVKKLWLCDQRDRRRIHLACSREAECSLEWIKYPTRQPVKHSTFPGCFTAHLNYVHWISFLKKRWNYLYKIRVDRGFYKLWKELPITIIFFFLIIHHRVA